MLAGMGRTYTSVLTRYHSGEWELITQQAAREVGLTIRIIRQDDPADTVRDPKRIRPIVLEWRESLSASLAEHVASPLEWDERWGVLYFKDKPTWDCYADLILWAAYDEQRQLQCPRRACGELVRRRSVSYDFKARCEGAIQATVRYFPLASVRLPVRV